MKVVITGSEGRIGRCAVAALAPRHEVRLIDRVAPRARPGLDLGSRVRADLSVAEDWRRWIPGVRAGPSRWELLFEGADRVLHLAAVPNPHVSMSEALRHNAQATWNVLQAAARKGVGRVILASSNRVLRRRLLEAAPACYEPDGPKIPADAPPDPESPYGLTKAMNEESGRMMAALGEIPSVLALRIGWFSEDPSRARDLDGVSRWIGPEDMGSLLQRCVEADFDGFHLAYAVSAQPESPFDLTSTCELLSWHPRQSSSGARRR